MLKLSQILKQNTMRKIVFLAIMIAVIMSCGSNKKEEAAPVKRIKVSVTAVARAKNIYDLEYSGSIEASQTIPLTFKTSGTVEKIYVEVGDIVKQGQLLASIDKSDVQNIYNTMLAKYQQAKDAYDRLKTVHDNGSLPEIKWVEMKSNFEQAKSMLDLSKNNLESCNMLAPTDGIIGSRNIEPGQSSLGLSAPFKLVKIENVFVKISVPENEISKIIKGQKAAFSVSALNGKKFEGIITNVSPVADMISRTYTAKILVKNAGLELKPGMVCDVTLNFSKGVISLVVPYKAVSKDSNGKNYVFVVSSDNQTVKRQFITVGQYNDEGIEVMNGLTEGQTIVCEGSEKLSDNSLISL
jgi:membrane fusion protein, multidrug efflux system